LSTIIATSGAVLVLCVYCGNNALWMGVYFSWSFARSCFFGAACGV
jgi:hypothetical protein